MKKIIFLSLFLVFAINNITAQAKKPISIITQGVGVKKYHEKSELDGMKKGELLTLYVERIKVLINTLPYIALTTKAGVTMEDLGVPETSENLKMLELQKENTASFLNTTVEFQKTMMSYSDKGNIVSSILYYESMLRALNQINE